MLRAPQTSEAPRLMTQSSHVAAAPSPAATASSTSAVGGALPEICYTLRRKVISFLDRQHLCAGAGAGQRENDGDGALRRAQSQTRASMDIVEEALRRYGPAELSLSYNGGKDCLVLLVLILASLPAIYGPSATTTVSVINNTASDARPSRHAPPPTLQAIYIAPPDPFPEVEDFVASTAEEYQLDLARYALPMRQALEAYQADRPSVTAIFMGTRRTDPHCELLTSFAPTDKGWPQFMRVNPILDWHYVDIWTFILSLDIPFCPLYQQGYSSLGGITNTRPNPALAIDAQANKFRPAYDLTRDDEERLGRDK